MLSFDIVHGDCLEKMATLADCSVDAVVTDPPYGLSSTPDMVDVLKSWLQDEEYRKGKGFMGAEWDSFVPGPKVWREVMRVLKPGGHVIAFASSRTIDLSVLAIRLAGFEVRDTLIWLYGSGMPKGKNLGDGWNTTLKPAHEPIVLARKPCSGSITNNQANWGVGGIHVDACRLAIADGDNIYAKNPHTTGGFGHGDAQVYGKSKGAPVYDPSQGRWPANVLHDGSEVVVQALSCFGERRSGGSGNHATSFGGGGIYTGGGEYKGRVYCDEGSAARFFYCAKATQADREAGLEDFEPQETWAVKHKFSSDPRMEKEQQRLPKRNNHPTVKPTELMRWLVRLVVPVGGLVLDPFAGSGSTGKACMSEGISFVGIEMDEHFCALARARVAQAQEAYAKQASMSDDDNAAGEQQLDFFNGET